MGLPLYLLDVVDVVPARSSAGPDSSFYLIVAATILVEAVVMLLMKYNTFGKSGLHSFIVNIVSLALGFLLFEMVPELFVADKIPNLVAMLLITIIAELPFLYLLNKQCPFKQTIRVCISMNIVTYLLFYLFIILIAK